MPDRYFIKDGYTPNPVISFDQNSNEANEYWEIAEHLAGSRSYQWPVYKRLGKMIDARGAKRVCDVGCGSALKLMEIASTRPNVTFVGFDQASAIRFCRKRHAGREFHEANLDEPIAYDGAKFDLVNCSDVIEHVAAPELLLKSLRSLVAPDGLILVSTPERDHTRGKQAMTCPNRYHVREWNQAEFEQFVRSEGFTIADTDLLFPMRIGRPLKLLADPIQRFFTLRPQRYNLWVALRPNAA